MRRLTSAPNPRRASADTWRPGSPAQASDSRSALRQSAPGGAGLGRGDQIVSWNGVAGMRQRDRFHSAAAAFTRQCPARLIRPLQDQALRRNTLRECRSATPRLACRSRRHSLAPEPQNLWRRGSRGRNDAQHCGGIANIRGKRPHAIQRRGKGDESVARDAAIGRQHAHHPAKTGGLANGAAGVGA